MTCVVQHYDKRAKKSKERREMRAESVATGEQVGVKHEKRKKARKVATPAATEPESFSFAALQDDEAPAYRGPDLYEEDARPFSPLVDEKALNERVLTGSSQTRTPVWKSGLMMAIFGWLLFIGTFAGETLGVQQYIFNGLAILVGLGAVVWTAPGSFAKEEGMTFRRRCRVAMSIGLGVLFLSALVLYMRLTG